MEKLMQWYCEEKLGQLEIWKWQTKHGPAWVQFSRKSPIPPGEGSDYD